MKNLRLSTLSLTLAIAVMTLGYVNVASAARPACPGDHPSCKDNDDLTDPPQTIYDVQLTLTFFDGMDAVIVDCSGETGLTKLGVKFTPGECSVVLDDGLPYYPIQIAVKNSRNARATFFFSNMCCDSPAGNDSVYEATSDVLLEPCADDCADAFPDASFKITVTDKQMFLIKTHNPSKELPLSESVTVGDLIYTAQ